MMAAAGERDRSDVLTEMRNGREESKKLGGRNSFLVIEERDSWKDRKIRN